MPGRGPERRDARFRRHLVQRVVDVRLLDRVERGAPAYKAG